MTDESDALFAELENIPSANNEAPQKNTKQAVDDSDKLFADLQNIPKVFQLDAPDIMPSFDTLGEIMIENPDAASRVMSEQSRESFNSIFPDHRLSLRQRNNIAGVMNTIKNVNMFKDFASKNPDIAKQIADNPSPETFEAVMPGSNYSEDQRKDIAKNLSELLSGKDPLAELSGLYNKQKAREIFKEGGAEPLKERELEGYAKFTENMGKSFEWGGVGGKIGLVSVGEAIIDIAQKSSEEAQALSASFMRKNSVSEDVVSFLSKPKSPIYAIANSSAARKTESWLEDTRKKLQREADKLNKEIFKGETMGDTYVKDGITGVLERSIYQAAQQVPNLALLIGSSLITGGAGAMAIAGATSGGEKYTSLKDRTDMSTFAKVLNAGLTGGFEAVGEKFGTLSVLDKIKEAGATQIGKSFLRPLLKMMGLGSIQEPTSEVVTMLGQKLTDALTGNSPIPLKDMSGIDFVNFITEDAPDTILSSALIGGALGGAGTAMSRVASPAKMVPAPVQTAEAVTPDLGLEQRKQQAVSDMMQRVEQKQVDVRKQQAVADMVARFEQRKTARAEAENNIMQMPQPTVSEFESLSQIKSDSSIKNLAQKYGIDSEGKSVQQLQDEISTADTRGIAKDKLNKLSNEEIRRIAEESGIDPKSKITSKLVDEIADSELRKQISKRRMAQLDKVEEREAQKNFSEIVLAPIDDKISLSKPDVQALNEFKNNFETSISNLKRNDLRKIAFDIGVNPVNKLLGKLKSAIAEQAVKAKKLEYVSEILSDKEYSDAIRVSSFAENVMNGNTGIPVQTVIKKPRSIKPPVIATKEGIDSIRFTPTTNVVDNPIPQKATEVTSLNPEGATILEMDTPELRGLADAKGISVPGKTKAQLQLELADDVNTEQRRTLRDTQTPSSIRYDVLNEEIKIMEKIDVPYKNDQEIMRRGIDLFNQDPDKHIADLMEGKLMIGEAPAAQSDMIAKRMAKEAVLRDPAYSDVDKKIAVYQYGKYGSAVSTALRLRKSKTTREVLFDAMYGDDNGNSTSKKRKRLIKKAELEGDPAAIRKLMKDFAKEDAETIQKVFNENGIDTDLTKITDEQWKDPEFLSPILNALSIARSTKWDKVHEWRRNLLLSGIATHRRNIESTMMHIIFKQIIYKTGQAGMGSALKAIFGGKIPKGYGDNLSTLSELAPMYTGMWNAMGDASRAALFAWKHEMPQSVFEGGADDIAKDIGATRVSIAGRKGRIIRAPQRALLSADEFMTIIIRSGNLNAQAVRSGIAKGYKPNSPEMTAFVTNLINNPEGTVEYRLATEDALNATFRDKLDVVGRFLNSARDLPYIGQLLKIQVPFFGTPYNIIKGGIALSPLNIINNIGDLYKWHDGLLENDRGAIDHAMENVVKSIIGIGGWAAVMSMVGYDDDGNPNITGSEWEGGVPPQHIKLFGKYYGYGYLTPFSLPMSAAVDSAHMIQKAMTGKVSAYNLFTESVVRGVKNLTGMPFVQGVQDLQKVFTQEKSFDNYTSNLALSFMVPRLLTSTLRGFDPYMRDYRMSSGQSMKEKLKEWSYVTAAKGLGLPPEDLIGYWSNTLSGKDLGNEAEGSLGLREIKTNEKIDEYGKPVTRGDLGGGELAMYTNALWQVLATSTSYEPGKYAWVDKLVMNWNNKNPDKPLDPVFITPNYLEIEGKRHVMTLAERGYYIKTRGNMYAELLDSNKVDLKTPDENAIDLLKKLRSSAIRSAALNTIEFINKRKGK